MEYDIELGKQLVDELVDLWVGTKIRCEKIEKLIIQLKSLKNN